MEPLEPLFSACSLQVTEVCFSPDESHCATCGEDGSVRLWALGTTELVVQFQVLNQVRLHGTSQSLPPGTGKCPLCHQVSANSLAELPVPGLETWSRWGVALSQ